MYNGEVNIYQEQLPALLAMADTLHICGLANIAGVSVILSLNKAKKKIIGTIIFKLLGNGKFILLVKKNYATFFYICCIL